MNNILILKPGAIGDLLHLTPVIRQIKANYPQAKISILVSSEATKSIFVNNPHVHKIFVYEKKGRHKKFSHFMALCREIKEEGFDIVLNYQRSNLRLWFLVAYLMPKKILVYHKDESKHAVINHLEAVKGLINVDFSDLNLEFNPGEEAENFAKDFFKNHNLDNKIVIALNPGASHRVNRWPIESFKELAQIIENELKAVSIIIGGKEDVELASEIMKNIKANPVNLAGRLSLPQLGAILKRCKVLITGDTGPMHIATAVGTKVVALFGAADPERTGPIGQKNIVITAKDVKCIPCKKRSCHNKIYLQCMTEIKPQMVFKKIKELL